MVADTEVDYYFTIVSPWSYLGHDRFMALANDSGLEVRFHPVDFGVVFRGSGGLPLPKRAPQRQRYRLFELQRWRQHLGLPLNLHPRTLSDRPRTWRPRDAGRVAHGS